MATLLKRCGFFNFNFLKIQISMKVTKNQTDITSIIASSSLGTLIEWYDFYIFGTLATVMGIKFFPADNPTASLLSTLATFAAGFIVRPFGALFFGRLGDLIGRKYTFLVTLVLMGSSTFVIGAIPTYDSIGWLSSLMVLILRLLQGLAVGGEYGGAVIYVAEHSHLRERGFRTSWIQTTPTLGLFVSLMVILITKQSMTETQFNDWGWRLPFLLSIILVAVSFMVRVKMEESPLFQQLQLKDETSQNPLKEALGNPTNFRLILMALFAVVMGSGVIWYTSQFYARLFLLNTCKIDPIQVDSWLCVALLFGTGGFVFWGWLSDKIGRKPILMTGMGLAILFTKPIFQSMYDISNPSSTSIISEKSNTDSQIVKKQIKTDTLKSKIAEYPKYTIDTVKNQLVLSTIDTSRIVITTVKYADSTIITTVKKATIFADSMTKPDNYRATTKKTVVLGTMHKPYIIGYLTILVLFVTMVYAPIAAFLVDLFPTKIRYTSLSLPYHIGNGVFGGLVPLFATIMFEYSKTNENPIGNPLAGLNYSMTIALVCLIIGTFFLPRNSKERENIGGNREYQF
jgi:MFS family permease